VWVYVLKRLLTVKMKDFTNDTLLLIHNQFISHSSCNS